MTALDKKDSRTEFESWFRSQFAYCYPLDVDAPDATLYGAKKTHVSYIWQEGFRAGRAAKPSEQVDGGVCCGCGDKWIGKYNGCRCFIPAESKHPSPDLKVLIKEIKHLKELNNPNRELSYMHGVSEACDTILGFIDELMKGQLQDFGRFQGNDDN